MHAAVLGGAGPAGFNVVLSLEEAGHEVTVIDQNRWRLAAISEGRRIVLQKPQTSALAAIEFVAQVCEDLDIEYLAVQPDGMVMWVSHYRDMFPPTFLPPEATVVMCQNKWETGWRWKRAGLRNLPSILVDGNWDEIEEQIGYPFWLRATQGAGARAATVCRNRATAEHWVGYWHSNPNNMHEFVAEEYLPGRDFAWTSVWHNGTLVTSQARERIEYIYPALAPSGRTGTPSVAVTVNDPDVNLTAHEAVLTIDPTPHGVYCVDLRHNAQGFPTPTEINAGRFFTTSLFYTRLGLNLPDLAAKLAVGGIPPMLPHFSPCPSGKAWVRHMDMGHHIVDADHATHLGQMSRTW